MALDFPNSPTLNQIFIGPNNIAWQWDNVKWTQVGVAVSQNTPVTPPGGRLTLTSGVPVMTADVAAATTIYYTPYNGNNIPIYNGTVFVPYAFAELSLALNATAHVTNTNYDLFVWNNAGTLQLVSGPAWSSAIARAAAIVFTQGIITNSASLAGIASGNTPVTVPANQATYVSTFRTTGAGQTAMVTNPAAASGGNPANIYLWNYYNRVAIQAAEIDNGAQYPYTSGTPSVMRGSGNNQIRLVIGVPEDSIIASVAVPFNPAAAASAFGTIGISLDSGSVIDVGDFIQLPTAISNNFTGKATKVYAPPMGYHLFSMMISSDGTHANNFGGSTGGYPTLNVQLRG
jgi:hypothetical protein